MSVRTYRSERREMKDKGNQGMRGRVEEDFKWQDEAKERKKERHMCWAQRNKGTIFSLDEGG